MASNAFRGHYRDVAGWRELRLDLRRLERADPSVLVTWPGPGAAGNPKPYVIRLAAHAEDVAAELHARYGRTVEIRVGALPYPPGREDDLDLRPPRHADVAESRDVRVEFDGRLIVRSGVDTSHRLLVTNLTDVPIEIIGSVSPEVVDPVTGVVVGGSTRPIVASLRHVTVAAHQTVPVEVVVGTESFDPALGYAVPPGQWAIRAILHVRDAFRDASTPANNRSISSPMLPITIISA